MTGPGRIYKRVYQIGGGEYSNPADCSIFLVDVGNGKSVMIDSGAGKTRGRTLKNFRQTGLDPDKLQSIILTHGHIDHIGGASWFKNRFGCTIIAHRKDADAIEGRNRKATAAHWYGIVYDGVTIDTVLTKGDTKLTIGDVKFNCIHTPGHTPGSISVYCDISGKRVLFGQDIHGPFDKSFGSNIDHWRESMEKLLALDSDILCEGHFGIFRGKNKVEEHINRYIKQYVPEEK